eukprot:TRINITY_DN15444_c0_g1_i4.p1 TRINITY_DN15444_c0_g1~~TRINITY_DN15444_c0_g1_i4.p1  ORF type:complete len:245 (+),score=81.80 TRINITY_DN15444_c0_g1_i4:92-826(+)
MFCWPRCPPFKVSSQMPGKNQEEQQQPLLPAPAPSAPATAQQKEAPAASATVQQEEAVTFKTFEVTGDVNMDGRLALDASSVTKNHLLVYKVQPGAISTYNSKQMSARTTVRLADRIIAINGELASADELKMKLEAISGAFTLQVEKPNVLGVKVGKESRKLGLSIKACMDHGALIVDIKDGCIADLNKAAPASERVKVNDIIWGKLTKDASGKATLEKMKDIEETTKYLSQDGDVSFACLSYS